MKSGLFILLTFNLWCMQCQGQENRQKTDFEKFAESFYTINVPYSYKTELKHPKLQKIENRDAFNYFGITEDDLKYNDFNYDFDNDIKYDRWVETSVYTCGKLLRENYIALIYTFGKNPTYGPYTFITKLNTFTHSGTLIDTITVRSQQTREFDWKDVIFLAKDILRIFYYEPNKENFNEHYYVIDETKPLTVVEIKDYQIDENGKINLIKTYPKQYLKELITSYRSYHEGSDDPMNE
jgi:hypothetical protein